MSLLFVIEFSAGSLPKRDIVMKYMIEESDLNRDFRNDFFLKKKTSHYPKKTDGR